MADCQPVASFCAWQGQRHQARNGQTNGHDDLLAARHLDAEASRRRGLIAYARAGHRSGRLSRRPRCSPAGRGWLRSDRNDPRIPDRAAGIRRCRAALSYPHRRSRRGALLPHSDAVVHSAATPVWTDISVDQMLSDNVIATRTLVRHAAAAKVSAFVFFSSIAAFGTIRTPVLTEAEPSVNVDTYGMSKLLGEKLLQDFADALPSLSIRLPTVIGRGSKHNWPSEALRKLKAGEPLEIAIPTRRSTMSCTRATSRRWLLRRSSADLAAPTWWSLAPPDERRPLRQCTCLLMPPARPRRSPHKRVIVAPS